jgi:hypothetical protein
MGQSRIEIHLYLLVLDVTPLRLREPPPSSSTAKRSNNNLDQVLDFDYRRVLATRNLLGF